MLKESKKKTGHKVEMACQEGGRKIQVLLYHCLCIV